VDTPPVGPVHVVSRGARWTTVNAEEAFPGVMLPMTWGFYGPGTARAMIQLWKDLGALPGSAPTEPGDVDDRFVATFYGRAAMNVERYGQMADRMPGTSAAALEEQFFGVARTGASRGTKRRYPMIAAKAPVAVLRARHHTVHGRAAVSAWRRRQVAAVPTVSPDRARRALLDAQERLEGALRRHIMLTMIAQSAFEGVTALCQDAGMAGAELALLTSRNGTDEYRLVCDAWEMSRARLSRPAFLDVHGYHGPDEGHLSGRVWREDPSPVLDLVESYRSQPESASPRAVARRRREASAETRTTLLAALPRHRRPAAVAQLGFAAAMPAIRETGKSTFLQIVDVGRCAARTVGGHLASQGTLAEPDDVFFLTPEELVGDATALRELVAQRKAEHETFLQVELPSSWTGNPVVREPDHGPPSDEDATGLGASAGIVEGRARVVVDPSTVGDLRSDDILVCHITDPSWCGLMSLAAAIVTDVGSILSHGAIIARELGIPCVVNTRDATRRFADGDRIAVDGTAGTVRKLDPAIAG
jgi:phosphohistidine swiveling domain-containing protein